MEEASVAGESPDRSKQRESSAEQTSGSAGPVPEKQDPRLAVARGEGDSGSSRKADTATRVLSVPQAAKGPDADAEAGDDVDAEGRGAGAGDGGGRLREAVAAWLRTAEPNSGDAAEGSSDASGVDGDAEGVEPAASDESPREGGPAGEDGRPSGGVTEDAAPSGDAAAEDDDQGDGPEGDAPKGEAPKGEAPKGEAPKGEAPKGATSEDADAEEADAEDADAEDADAEDADAEDADAEDADAEDADAEDEAGEAEAAEAAADKAGEGKEAARAAGDEARDGREATAEADEGKGDGRGSDKTAAGVAAGDGEADAKGTHKAGDAGTDGGEVDAKADEAAAAEADAGESTAQDADGTTGGGKGTDETGDAGTDGGKRDSETPDADRDEDGRTGDDAPVDQPTAVFRAPRPAGPAVDQPTTMLKLGDAAARTGAGAGEAERTSKFVALKPDPAIGAPRQGGPAPAESTTFLPQVGPERTTQQPLPPKPPLDLLAELTNTPPPPQTPLRTAVRRIKIWTPLVILLLIVFAIVQNVRPLPAPTLALTAEDTHTFDGDPVKLPWPGEGQGWMSGDGIGTMDHFGEQKPVAIGSVAKTMTAYIILREHPLKPGEEGPKIEVDAKAEEEGGYDKAGESTLNTVKAGDFLTEKQALSAVMIPSANNIARLLARWDAGSEEAFVKKMNDTAKELGMTNTTYTDPSGLKETTVSTAEDQTKLGIAAMRNPAMVAITSAASWTDPSGQYWSNYNELPYTMGAIGIKTGSTTKAGGNLLFAARKKVGGQEVTVVGAILGQHKGPSILDTVNEVSKPALRAAQDALTSADILRKGTVVGYVDDGLGGRTPVAVTEDVKAVGWAGLEVKLTFAGTELPHTAKAGTKVGTLTVGDGENGAVKVPVALKADLVEPGFTDRLTRVA
ncbi:D-alanyl-D-alanine carboxypeptidase [Streptomyces sp. enrichment culture]|uniref:D-alanyl-D-alanine carboxypeptidase family protein n=1 Tax=Streptomyces sp. enrichment culture TaxID=1795815 RepID=UPI003F557E42